MRILLSLLFVLFTVPAFAASYTYDLRFEGDTALELQSGFDSRDRCFAGQDCFPDDFRLANGTFAALQPGEVVQATVDYDNGTASIGGQVFEGFFNSTTGMSTTLFSDNPFSSISFGPDSVTLVNEGPLGANASGSCDPDDPQPGLPAGFCGFAGYQANFAVEGDSDVELIATPLPAGGLLLLTGFGFLAAARRRQS